VALVALLVGPASPKAWAGVPAATALPGVASSAFDTAQRLLHRGSPAAALSLAESQPEVQAREPRWRFLRGLALTALGQVEDAVAVYTRLTQDFPDIAEPHNNLAVLRAGQGRLDEARDSLERALRANPAQREAHENLGDVHLRLAIRHWEAAAAVSAGQSVPEAGLVRKLRLARELAAPPR
jgi:tetratricopeptide (TPR) repeat protein